MSNEHTSAVFCEHANECSQTCQCPDNCYCRLHTCKNRQSQANAKPPIRRYDFPAPVSTNRDGLMVVEYSQDADSLGLSVVALIHANYKPDAPRWGVLDALVATDHGELPDTHSSSNPHGTHRRTSDDVVRDSWNLVDWYPNEDAARAAYQEVKSRQW